MLHPNASVQQPIEHQVNAATQLLHRSIDNEIALGATVARQQQVINQLSEANARLLNTDIEGLRQQVLERDQALAQMTQERDETLQQFGVVKQRESGLKEEIRKLKEELVKKDETIASLKSNSKPAAKSAPKKPTTKS
jgi:chorismate mutase